ncbi:MAG TPA: signal peptidase I, partial [Planctomycetes bacterium]|nr:signal peptidase I [Planctomycetota bacterium]
MSGTEKKDAADAGWKKENAKGSGFTAFRNFMIAAAVALGLRFFVMEPFQIPTGSMEPTMIGREGWGDRIFAGKFSYSRTVGSAPRRWDVVVFYLQEPGTKKKRLVKRLAGLPGETIEIADGDIYVDGKILRKPAGLPGADDTRDIQSSLWHTLYDGDFSNPIETRHWPWVVETGPTDAWAFEDGMLTVNNAGQNPAIIRYDGSQRGVHL